MIASEEPTLVQLTPSNSPVISITHSPSLASTISSEHSFLQCRIMQTVSVFVFRSLCKLRFPFSPNAGLNLFLLSD